MTRVTSYQPLPITFTHGKGAWVYDTEGKAYLDGLSGIAVCGLGHAHAEVTSVIQEQAAKLLHTSNGFRILEQEQLAEKLLGLSGMEQAFFSNSGAEANEAAIKLTRLYGHKKGIETPSIIVMEGAFHGRTMATLTASGSRKVQAGFEPLVPGFIRAPFNEIEAIKKIAQVRKDVVAVMIELVQGEGGIHMAEPEYLHALAALCKENDWLLVVDEIQTGNARTGEFFAYMHTQIEPDIVTVAKGLGNGIPIGATLMRHKACNLFKPGNHGSTFGGNPLACATALKVLEIIQRENLAERASQLGNSIKKGLQQELASLQGVQDIRGLGLMIGIELDRFATGTRQIGLAEGVLFNVTSDTVVRLLPPLILSNEEAALLVERVSKSIRTFLAR